MVNGALGLLTEAFRWEQHGDMTPNEAADLAFLMWWEWATQEGSLLLGSVFAYATATLPDGVLLCDGSEYDRDDYPELYEVLDSAFIVDPDTFRVPNIADRVVMGNTPVGQTGGAASVALAVDELPAHTHTIQNGYGPGVIGGYIGETPAMVPAPTPEISSSAGAGAAHENRPPFIRLRYGIVAR